MEANNWKIITVKESWGEYFSYFEEDKRYSGAGNTVEESEKSLMELYKS